MNEKNLDTLRHELAISGSHPTRHQFIVGAIRRLLWPFMRPYLFQLQAQFYYSHRDVSAKINEFNLANENEITLLRNKITELVTSKDLTLEDGKNSIMRLNKLALLNSSETAVLRNRINELERASENLEMRIGATELAGTAHEKLNDEKSQIETRRFALTSYKNFTMMLKPGEIISDTVLGGGSWDEHVMAVAQAVSSQRGGSAIDVGAHFGLISIPMCAMFARVLAFEPNNFNFSVLRTNIAINQLTNIEAHNTPLFSDHRELALANSAYQEMPLPLNEGGGFDGMSGTNLGAYSFQSGTGSLFKHQARIIDDFEISDLAFLKIDVQGADGEILIGARMTIQRCRPTIIFEWEKHLAENFNVPFSAIEELLAACDYEIEILKQHNDKQVDYIAVPRVHNK